MAYPNFYQQPYYPQMQPYQQMQQMPQQMNVAQPMQTTPQMQNGGFVSVPNEDAVMTYPVAAGNCITFKIEGRPIVMEKSMGFSQLESPRIERYRLVKEDSVDKVEETPKEEVSYTLQSDFDVLQSEVNKLRADVNKLMSVKKVKCVKKGDELYPRSLEIIDKLTHSIKSIDTILAMEDAGYSNDSSYARGRGRYAKRDSMGRYARRDGSYDDGSYDDMSYDGYGRDNYARRNRGRYSREEAKDELMNELRELQMDAKDEESRHMLKEWIKQLEQK